MTNITLNRTLSSLRSVNGLTTYILHHDRCLEAASYLSQGRASAIAAGCDVRLSRAGKYLLHEFVIMPDHIHGLLTPAPTIALERALQFIKGGFSYRLRKMEKMEVWQPSFTNHRIRDAEDFEGHRSYIHLNPVRAKLVMEPGAYPYSSANPAFKADEAPLGLKPTFRESA